MKTGERSSGENGPVSAERLAADEERDVRAVAGVQQGAEVCPHVRLRHVEGVAAGQHGDPAHDGEAAIGLDVGWHELASLHEPPPPVPVLAVGREDNRGASLPPGLAVFAHHGGLEDGFDILRFVFELEEDGDVLAVVIPPGPGPCSGSS